MMPVMNTPSKVPAPPIDTTGTSAPPTLTAMVVLRSLLRPARRAEPGRARVA
jgi:hypothetical protein